MIETGLTIDDNELLDKFSALTSNKQDKVYRNALKKSSDILAREARKQLKSVVGNKVYHKNRWNGKTLQSGIKVSVNRQKVNFGLNSVFTNKVHLLGDFRLRFFELGTKERYLKKRRDKKISRGKMKATHFFERANKIKGEEARSSFHNALKKSIERITKK